MKKLTEYTKKELIMIIEDMEEIKDELLNEITALHGRNKELSNLMIHLALVCMAVGLLAGIILGGFL